MNNELKILIVLVYYKRPQIVLNALDSIKNISYSNWELHFIDDSGDDSFRETFLNYGLDSSKIKYTAIGDTTEQKLTQGGSRHGYFMTESILDSDSDLVVILCDDDAIIKDYFIHLNNFYQENSLINWAYSKVLFFDPTKESYLEAKPTPTFYHNGSAYSDLNNYSIPIHPSCKVDGSQVTFRAKIFKEGGIRYPSPQTRNLDASIFSQIANQYGLCFPTYIWGQYKAAFLDQLGNRWADSSNEFNINNP